MVEDARLNPAALPAAVAEASSLVDALNASTTGFLESYRGQTWPVDTVVLVAAAARGLAADLEREAELLGLPLTWRGERRYAGDVLPVGDTFLAWARSVPASSSQASADGPRPAWVALVGAPLLLAAGLSVLGVRMIRDRKSRSR